MARCSIICKQCDTKMIVSRIRFNGHVFNCPNPRCERCVHEFNEITIKY